MFNPDSPFYIKWRWDRDLKVAWLWQFRKASTMRRVRQAMPLLRDMHLESFRLYEALAAYLNWIALPLGTRAGSCCARPSIRA